MVVDTSAVVTILLREPGSDRFAKALNEAESLQMSAASVLDVGIVVASRYGQVARDSFDRWIENAAVEVLVVTRAQIEAAR
jgi:ribonuclease VapC